MPSINHCLLGSAITRLKEILLNQAWAVRRVSYGETSFPQFLTLARNKGCLLREVPSASAAAIYADCAADLCVAVSSCDIPLFPLRFVWQFLFK